MKNYVDSQDSIFNTSNNNYILDNNVSVNNYIVDTNSTLATWVDTLFVRFTELVDQVGNWSADKVNYVLNSELNNGTYVIDSVLDKEGWRDEPTKLTRIAGKRITVLVKDRLEKEITPMIKEALKKFDAEAYIKEVIREQVQTKKDRAFNKMGALRLH